MRGSYSIKITTTVLNLALARCMFRPRKSLSGEGGMKYQKEDSAGFERHLFLTKLDMIIKRPKFQLLFIL